jgi:hypothetical protein
MQVRILTQLRKKTLARSGVACVFHVQAKYTTINNSLQALPITTVKAPPVATLFPRALNVVADRRPAPAHAKAKQAAPPRTAAMCPRAPTAATGRETALATAATIISTVKPLYATLC